MRGTQANSFSVMQAVRLKALLVVLTAGLFNCVSAAGYVSHVGHEQDFALVHKQKVAPIYIDEAEPQGLKLAVANLQGDIFKVSGANAKLLHSKKTTDTLLIVGTLQNSSLLKELVASGKLKVEELEGQWEGFHIQTIQRPFKNVEQAVVIAGSDMRGAIFGVYDLSEKIGVSPWYWWADVPVKQAKSLFVKADTLVQDKPKVRYRGIFLNDEAPALSGWVHAKFGDYNSEFYQHVFELLLRLKANFLWPAMWNNAFSLDDPNNPQLANTMGIVMSTSHHEPMMRADKEWNRVGKGKWDYAVNSQNLYQFWQEGAKRHLNLESVFTLGMRGQQDEPMGETENIALLEKIVADQRKILGETFGQDKLTEVPQVWALYKEVQGYYENGMRVPDDVTLLWSDDNWGNLRRLPTPEERQRSGGAGVYYHFDYVGGPRSYRWINTVPIAKIWEQMNLAYQYQANRIWLTNVGDLKPMEFPTDFFLRMAWNPEQYKADNLIEYGQQWATQQFGAEYAKEIEQIMTVYTRHNGRRKPELMSADTYSVLNYQEAERVSTELQDYVSRAQAIYAKLPANTQDAFFQLVLHPVKATAIINQLYYSQALNHLYASQGRASTNDYAQAVKDWFAADQALEEQYHQLGDGRWDHFMSQPHIGYTHWNNPPTNTLPVVSVNQPAPVADMGVAVEGNAVAWPQPTRLALDFDRYGQQQRYIDVFNKGTLSFDITVKASDDWIQVKDIPSQIAKENRLWVNIDWAKVPSQQATGQIMIKGTGWGGATINISAFKPSANDVHGFVEADGYIALEAASGTEGNTNQRAQWQEIPNHGRTASSMTGLLTHPEQSFINDPAQAPYLEYPLYFFSQGPVEITTVVAPSLNFVPDRGIRFAIGFADETPQIVDILADNSQQSWEESVKNAVKTLSSQHKVAKPGIQKLRLYLLESGLTVQKIIINTGNLKASYLGPVQSQFIP